MILLVLAILCAAIVTLMGFDIIGATHIYGWLGLTLFFFLLHLVWDWSPARRVPPHA